MFDIGYQITNLIDAMNNTNTHTLFETRVNNSIEKNGIWDTTQKLLSGCFTNVFGLGVDNFPDTPEVDELRHEIHESVEYYKEEKDIQLIRNALESVREQLSDNMELYILG